MQRGAGRRSKFNQQTRQRAAGHRTRRKVREAGTRARASWFVTSKAQKPWLWKKHGDEQIHEPLNLLHFSLFLLNVSLWWLELFKVQYARWFNRFFLSTDGWWWWRRGYRRETRGFASEGFPTFPIFTSHRIETIQVYVTACSWW